MVALNALENSVTKHVLLVDDYADALETWSMLLTASGHSVATAGTGAAAFLRVAERVPDVVVLDLQLPDVSGLEVGRRLRADTATARVTLIALTGRALTPDAAAELESIFDTVLIKPCDPRELMTCLEAERTAVPASEPAA